MKLDYDTCVHAFVQGRLRKYDIERKGVQGDCMYAYVIFFIKFYL